MPFLFFGHDFDPLTGLFLFPETFLTLPIGSTIVPKVEINIKGFANKSSEAINHEANILVCNREMIVMITLESNVKTMCRIIETGLQSETHRLLSQTKSEPTKRSKQEERLINPRGWVMNRGAKTIRNVTLERQNRREV